MMCMSMRSRHPGANLSAGRRVVPRHRLSGSHDQGQFHSLAARRECSCSRGIHALRISGDVACKVYAVAEQGVGPVALNPTQQAQQSHGGHTALLHGLGALGDVPPALMPWLLRLADVQVWVFILRVCHPRRVLAVAQ
jgi:hypothetical protein